MSKRIGTGYFDELDMDVNEYDFSLIDTENSTIDRTIMMLLVRVLNDIRLRMEDHRPIFVEPKPIGTPKNRTEKDNVVPDGTNGGHAWRKA